MREGNSMRFGRHHLFRFVLAAAAMTALAGCHVTIAASPPHARPQHAKSANRAPSHAATATDASSKLVVIHDPGQVTGTLTGSCHYRAGGQLPDPRCTPGAIDPSVTQADIRQTICVSGYTSKVRPSESQTERFKFDVAYPAYGDPRADKTELDHLVSLELGGANDATNLWPESPPTPNPKDKVENALHRAVCDGRVTLAAAQRAIARDWMTAESVLGLS